MQPPHSGEVRIERLDSIDDSVLALIEEYYEAVGVMQRDGPETMRMSLRAKGSGLWVAYLKQEPVGCVLMRVLATIPLAGECKRLYVKPSARGRGIADRLMDALEHYARDQGFQWIYLDTHDGLHAALALYERRGYERCERYNDNPQATIFLRKCLESGQMLSR